MAQADRTQANVRLRAEQKERWQAHADESRYDDSMSDLIKRAVENQIDRDTGETSPSGGTGGTSTEDVNRITTELGRLETAISELSDDVGEAVTAVYGQNGLDQETLNWVFSALPEGKASAATSQDIAETVDVPGNGDIDESTTRLALHILDDSTNAVDYVEDTMEEGGELVLPHWYVRE